MRLPCAIIDCNQGIGPKAGAQPSPNPRSRTPILTGHLCNRLLHDCAKEPAVYKWTLAMLRLSFNRNGFWSRIHRNSRRVGKAAERRVGDRPLDFSVSPLFSIRIGWLMLWVTPEEKSTIRAKGRRAHSLSASSGGIPAVTMVLTAWGSGPKNRGMTWPEWSRVGFVAPRFPSRYPPSSRVGQATVTGLSYDFEQALSIIEIASTTIERLSSGIAARIRANFSWCTWESSPAVSRPFLVSRINTARPSWRSKLR
jgi:hypothetical protein